MIINAMRKKYLPLLLVFLLTACSKDPNQPYIDKVAEKVKSNDLGLNIGYRNIEFIWEDTVFQDGVAVEYHARNTYRMMVGEIDEKITAEITFDSDFNIIEIE